MDNKEDIREQILSSALKLMNQLGYGSLSLSELARQANITKQRLYYHFPSTEDVLILLAQEWSSTGQACTIEALAATHEVGASKIFAISQGMFKWMRNHPQLSRLGLVIHQSSPHIKKLNRFTKTAQQIGRDRIKDLLMQDKDFLALSDSDLEKGVTAIHSMMYGFYFYIISMNDFGNLETHEENCNEALRRLIQSYR